MTRTPEATARPWIATKAGPTMAGYSQGDAIASLQHNTLVAGCFSDVQGGPDVADANARLIVRAVNAHDALVEALKRVLQDIDFMVEDGTLRDIRNDIIYAAARAALALAGEGEGR
jgi:hypothetical protein